MEREREGESDREKQAGLMSSVSESLLVGMEPKCGYHEQELCKKSYLKTSD